MNKLSVPVSIIIAGVIIGGAIVFVNYFGNNGEEVVVSESQTVRPIQEIDHILGNPDAPIKIVEYSDYECPFCQKIHPTLSRIVEEFDGEVLWAYRHLPLSQIHSRAVGAAVASECLARLGGNEVFWDFTNGIFGDELSLDIDAATTFAEQYRIDKETFETCLSDESVLEKVRTDAQEGADMAVASTGRVGTPLVVVLDENNEPFVFSGALPYEQIESIINQLIQK